MIGPAEHAAVRRRRRYRYVRLLVPIVSAYVDRLRDAALDGERCRTIVVAVPAATPPPVPPPS
jgi:hypothetical protein